MIKIVFIILFSLHAAIHIIGFAKARKLATLDGLKLDIPQAHGWLWLAVSILLLISAFLLIAKWPLWWSIAAPSVILSQILIITSWQDAKFGTVVNLILLLAIAIGIGQWQFKNQVERAKAEISETSLTIDLALLDEDDLKKNLPKAVENWTSACAESRTVGIYQFEQRGRMKLKPDDSWREFEARQWSSVHAPEFVWNVTVGKSSFVQFNGLDRLVAGEGRMKISILSLVPVVNKGGPEIDRASAIRYLAEMVWYPEAADRSFVEWEEIDRHTAKATLSAADFQVEGTFFFDDQDRPVRFEAMRYSDQNQRDELWIVNIDSSSYTSFGEAQLPTRATISWQFENEKFTWYEVEVLNRSVYSATN